MAPRGGGKGRGGKPQCELGKQCPYLHEMQHVQEFAHDLDGPPKEPKAFEGKGRTLGGGSSTRLSAGRVLGEGKRNVCRRASPAPKKKAASSPKQAPPPPKVKAAKAAKPSSGKPPTSRSSPIVIDSDDDDDDDEVQILEDVVEIAGKKKPRKRERSKSPDVEIVEKPPPPKKKKTRPPPPPKIEPKLPAEFFMPRPGDAERQERELVCAEQDLEYEVSLRADREKARRKRDEDAEKKAEAELEAVLAASKVSAEEDIAKRKEQTKKRLDQRVPDGAASVRVRARYPDGTAKVHTFPAAAPIADLFAFVDLHKPDGVSSNLDVVDNASRTRLKDQAKRKGVESASFSDFGLSGCLSLLVIDEDL
mmetsp:Transcript_17408/g.53039  ORF Transcript_17408/g.53039 Transcript_17408/m.53039 type:complete len:364 (+) Transcript_17408:41-1132(+)